MEPRFLEYWLLSPTAQKHIDAMKTGISESGLNLTHARFVRLPVPIPSLSEQRRIVELLEDHLSRLDAARAGLSDVARRLELWQQQMLGYLLWSEEYPRIQVGELLRERMRNGRSDRAVQGAEVGTKTLTLTAVTKNSFVEENTKQTRTTTNQAAGLWLEPGDIFVQRANTPDLVGTTAQYWGNPGWAIFPDLLIRLRADGAKIDSRFLTAALRSARGHRQLRVMAKGLAGSMPKIDQAAISSALVPVPQLSVQRQLLNQVDMVERARERLQGTIDRACSEAEALRRALLMAAFSGQLTPKEVNRPSGPETL